MRCRALSYTLIVQYARLLLWSRFRFKGRPAGSGADGNATTCTAYDGSALLTRSWPATAFGCFAADDMHHVMALDVAQGVCGRCWAQLRPDPGASPSAKDGQGSPAPGAQ